jgi:hypothetical protein
LDGSHEQCAGDATGVLCVPACNAAYQFVTTPNNTNKAIECIYGTWFIRGTCIREEIVILGNVDLVTVPAALMSIIVLTNPNDLASQATANAPNLDYQWANENEAVVVSALAKALVVDSSRILLEVLMPAMIPTMLSSAGRRLPSAAMQGNTSLQQAISFGLRSYLILDPPGDANFANLNFVNVASQFIAELKAQSTVLPLGLSAATAELRPPPVYIPEYVTASSAWQTGPWSTGCSTTCGNGIDTRLVACPRSSHNPLACDVEPAAQQACNRWDGCPKTFLCPMGESPANSCASQSGMVLGGIGAIILCCCGCCGLWVARKCRKPKYGEEAIFIPDETRVEAGEAAKAKNEKVKWHSEDVSSDEPRSPGKLKTKIIWDLSQDFLEKHATRGELLVVAEENEKSDAEERGQVSTRSTSESRDQAAGLTLMNIQVHNAELPYQRYHTIEYFSKTNQVWVRGEILEDPEVWPGRSAPIVYTVGVGIRTQVRRQVPLMALRFPLQKYERCEVLSKQLDRWVPGIIAEDQPIAPTSAGYCARLCTSDGTLRQDAQSLVRVAANRVRRRFPIDQEVEFYAGEVEGWIKAIIVEPGNNKNNLRGASQTAGDGEANRDSEAIVDTSAIKISVVDDDGYHLLLYDEAGKQPGAIPLWAQVKVSLPEQGGTVKVVSAHLLRNSGLGLERVPGASVRDTESEVNLSDIASEMNLSDLCSERSKSTLLSDVALSDLASQAGDRRI